MVSTAVVSRRSFSPVICSRFTAARAKLSFIAFHVSGRIALRS